MTPLPPHSPPPLGLLFDSRNVPAVFPGTRLSPNSMPCSSALRFRALNRARLESPSWKRVLLVTNWYLVIAAFFFQSPRQPLACQHLEGLLAAASEESLPPDKSRAEPKIKSFCNDWLPVRHAVAQVFPFFLARKWLRRSTPRKVRLWVWYVMSGGGSFCHIVID